MTLHLLPPGPQHTLSSALTAIGTGFLMQKDDQGYFHVDVPNVQHGDRYTYQPDGATTSPDGATASPDGATTCPDPASPWQPDGVHGPSAVVDHQRYTWTDSHWHGLPFSSLIFYELHVGAFTPEGTFEAIIPRLPELAALGINALELMPVSQFPGRRNWGYDNVFLYAVQDSYGGPEGLKRLVDACHNHGIAVFLDVIYNHIGREGNVLHQFGPYFSGKYHTPWGEALNFDEAWSDGVKDFITGNAIYWAESYHIDGLRLDAIHEIFDRNAVTIFDQLHDAVTTSQQQNGRSFYLIAESDTNSPRTVRSPASGGCGFDAQWLDDFHHSLYVLLDPNGRRYYEDFGRLDQLAKAYTEGFVHSNEYVRFRHRRHGASSAGIPGDKFIVFNQNHDIPGNRPGGERLSMLVDLPRLKLAAAAILLSPYLPMLFMGEEYGEKAPFYFFSDYSDPEIIRGLSSRQQQFAAFNFEGEPRDPQPEETFIASRLNWDHRTKDEHAALLEWHRQLIALRRTHPLLKDLSKVNFRADLLGNQGLALSRHSADQSQSLLCLLNFSPDPLNTNVPAPVAPWGVAIYQSTPSTAAMEPVIK